MYKFFSFLLIQLCISSILFGQQPSSDISTPYRCGTANPTPEQIAFTKQMMLKSSHLRKKSSKTYIALKAHVVNNNDGSTNISIADLNKGLANINYVFKDANLEFYWKEMPSYVNNSDYATYDERSPDSDSETGLRGLFTPATNAVNIYYVNSFTDASGFRAGGMAYFPHPDAIYNTMYMIKNAQAAPVNGTFAHEFGHYFNLYHTHQGTQNGANHAQAENVARTGANANCSSTGDLLCDTQADPLYDSAIFNYNACAYTGNQRDRFNVLYTPPIDNIMSYFPNHCGVNHFTNEQYDRIVAGANERLSHTNYSITAPPQTVAAASGLAAVQFGEIARLTWTDNANNDMGYLIERSSISATDGFEAVHYGGTNASATTFDDITVVKNNTYYYRIKAANGGAVYSNVVSVPIVPFYCTPSYSNICYVHPSTSTPFSIKSVTISNSSNTVLLTNDNNNCLGALSNYTNMSAAVNANESYTFTIIARQSSGGQYYPQRIGIWLDSNDDKDFEDAGEFLGTFISSNNSATVMGSFTVPISALNGNRRLRVRSVQESDVLTAADVCKNYLVGEAEDYTLNVSGGAVMPLDLLSFTAKKQDNNNGILTWETANEQAITMFEVQVSTDGKEFQTLSTMKPKGSGVYEVEHQNPTPEIHYYRLIEKNEVGKERILANTYLDFSTKKSFQIIPNPTQGLVKIIFESAKNEILPIYIYDMLGRVVATQTIESQKGFNEINFEMLSSLNEGIYWVVMQQEGELKKQLIKKQ